MKFAARSLPKELKLDAATGIISGTAPKRGNHTVRLRATNSLGPLRSESNSLAVGPPGFEPGTMRL